MEEELIRLENQLFMLQMQDVWDSNDYKTSDELSEKIKKIKEKMNGRK